MIKCSSGIYPKESLENSKKGSEVASEAPPPTVPLQAQRKKDRREKKRQNNPIIGGIMVILDR
jgi:hypothetical protein